MVGTPDLGGYLSGNALIVLILVGFVLAFFGKTFFKATWFLVGGLMGAAVGLALGYFLGGYVYNQTVCSIIGALIGFVAGGFLVLQWARNIMCFMIAGAAFMMTFSIAGVLHKSTSDALIIAVIVAVIIFIIVYIKFDDVLSIVTAFLGGFIIGAIVSYKFFGGNLIVLLAIGIPITIAGLYVQLELHKKYPEHSYDRDKDDQVKSGDR